MAATNEITRRLSPKDEELLRKREELLSVRASLAERELELADLRGQLAAFEGLYLRQVGVLYAELDRWDALVAELTAKLEGSSSARQRAERARKRAEESHDATHGEAAAVPEFRSSADLKNLFRDVAKSIHPDFAENDADQERRTRFMTEANEAYRRGDAEALEQILNEYRGSDDSVLGEGVGAELVRVIRQIAQAKKRIAEIEQELVSLRAGELAQLTKDVQEAKQRGRDLLAELAGKVGEQIERAKKEHDGLAREVKR